MFSSLSRLFTPRNVNTPPDSDSRPGLRQSLASEGTVPVTLPSDLRPARIIQPLDDRRAVPAAVAEVTSAGTRDLDRDVHTVNVTSPSSEHTTNTVSSPTVNATRATVSADGRARDKNIV